ncbi:hypothetical protein AB6A40_001410 [Gnathostoma spinigerum]|uniref:Uncharacterized protein n=1 Tax=Gnathostoma spinigerum TaxID=75299 RepID=A0ABD6E6C2_9BILA
MSWFHIFTITCVVLNVNGRLPYIVDPVALYSTANESPYKWETKYFDVVLDHCSYINTKTFKLRYLINTDHFKRDAPIFFYAGNEGPITHFAENCGFLFDLAPKYNAAVVFAEHRYYGETMPYGEQSFDSIEKLGYLSAEQAIADFADLIVHFREKRLITENDAKNSPVILFGGSYGGMLAAWMRIKYPHLVQGAIASSAPVFWFLGTKTPEDIYDVLVTKSFVNFGGCVKENVYNGFQAIDRLAETERGRRQLNEMFKLAPNSVLRKKDDSIHLKWFIRGAFETMAMINYPYETGLMGKQPGYPVKVACEFFNYKGEKSDIEKAETMYKMANLFYNYTGKEVTFETISERFPSRKFPDMGWPWQICTEMVMQLCSNGLPNDFFWKDCPFTTQKELEKCTDWFGYAGYKKELLRPYWILKEYGDHFPSASNIVFSNGDIDPWSGGAWSDKDEVVGSLVSIIIKDGAHHYELRGKNPKDTKSVIEAREKEEKYIKQWIDEYRKQKNPTK